VDYLPPPNRTELEANADRAREKAKIYEAEVVAADAERERRSLAGSSPVFVSALGGQFVARLRSLVGAARGR
jgi:hypothetical protein